MGKGWAIGGDSDGEGAEVGDGTVCRHTGAVLKIYRYHSRRESTPHSQRIRKVVKYQNTIPGRPKSKDLVLLVLQLVV